MGMVLRQLGRTGLHVSPLTLGSMEVGGKVTEEEAGHLLAMAVDAGINMVDTANVYGAGASEEIVGRLIAPMRDRLLLATKFSVPTDADDPNSGGTSRRAVIAACEASLRRLGTDHIDLYYLHRPFTQTAIDETLHALDDLVRAGKVRSIGTSGLSGWQIVESLWCAHDLGLNRPVVEQTAYHLLDRRAERDLVPACLTHDTAITVWSPLAGGLLTGKYLSQDSVAGARLSRNDAWGAKHFTPAANSAVSELAKLADAVDVSLLSLSLAWTLQRPGVASLICGPRNRQQFTDQLAAVEVLLTDDVLDAIDRIVPPGGVTVPYYLDDDFADFRPQPYHW
jgi:aryl-alcohol dehydrogenase-like predicted oxidoreductase